MSWAGWGPHGGCWEAGGGPEVDEGGIGGVAMGATTMSPCRDPPQGAVQG